MSRSKKMFMQDIHPKKGALHRMLHVPMDEKIPAKKLTKATHSKNLLQKRRAILAQTYRRAKHHGSR